MKNLPPEVRAQIGEIKNNLLPEALIPGSRLYKKNELIEAEAVLQYAKSMNRPVRKAPSDECEFSRLLPNKQKTIVITIQGLFNTKEAAKRLGISKNTIPHWKRQGKIKSVCKIKGIVYYSEEEIRRISKEEIIKSNDSKNIQKYKIEEN